MLRDVLTLLDELTELTSDVASWDLGILALQRIHVTKS